jgi:hypothetical protein
MRDPRELRSTVNPPGLPEFLLARLAEVEADARDAAAARGPEWHVEDQPDRPWGHGPGDPVILASGKPIVKVTDYGTGVEWHIARHDPARVLAWCAALRAVVAEHGGAHRCPNHLMHDEGPCRTLRALAQIWADHPGFDPAWR